MRIVRIFCDGEGNYVVRQTNGTEYPGFDSYTAAERFALTHGMVIAR